MAYLILLHFLASEIHLVNNCVTNERSPASNLFDNFLQLLPKTLKLLIYSRREVQSKVKLVFIIIAKGRVAPQVKSMKYEILQHEKMIFIDYVS